MHWLFADLLDLSWNNFWQPEAGQATVKALFTSSSLPTESAASTTQGGADVAKDAVVVRRVRAVLVVFTEPMRCCVGFARALLPFASVASASARVLYFR